MSTPPPVTLDISIVIPSYNRGETVARNVGRCLALNPAPREIVLVDDASNDGSEAILRSLEGGIVVLLRLDRNIGQAGARNAGFARAAGRYIVSLDDDSWFLQDDALRRIWDRLERMPSTGILSFRCFSPGMDIEPPAERLTLVSDHMTCGAAYRAELLHEVGYHVPFLRYMGEESDLSLKVLDAGADIVQDDSITFFHDFDPSRRSEASLAAVRYLATRNDLARAWIYFPMHVALAVTAWQVMSQVRHGARVGSLGATLRGIAGVLPVLGRVLAARRPVRTATARRYFDLRRHPAAIEARTLTVPEASVPGETPGPRPRPRVLLANAGTVTAFETAAQLRRHGLLGRFVTSLFFDRLSFWWLPAALASRLRAITSNRRHPRLDGLVDTYAWPEVVSLALDAVGLARHSQLVDWRNRTFCHWVAAHRLDDVDLVWALDTSANEIFMEAKRRGIPCVLDMSIAHPALGRRLMDDYAATRPQIARCMDTPVDDRAVERRDREIALADHVVVCSSFVRDSILERGVDPARITVNPYGVGLDAFSARRQPPGPAQPIRYLFVGWLSARKGIYDLMEAWNASGLTTLGCDLTVAGGTADDLACWKGAVPPGVHFAGRLPHAALPDLYASRDVFVFPSLFEGSARVVIEAMASGLAIITTAEACDERWVVDGDNGYRVRAGDVATLADRMQSLARSPERVATMGRRSVERAARHSWESYGDVCAQVCRQVLEGRA